MLFMIMAFVAIGLYTMMYIRYMDELFERIRHHFLWGWAASFLSLLIFILVVIMGVHRFGLLIMMTGMLVITRFLYRMSKTQMIYASSLYVFAVFSSRGIIVSIFSLAQHKSIGQVLTEKYYYLILFLAVILSISINWILRVKLAPDDLSKHLVNNSSQLLIVAIFLLTQIFYLLLINNGRFLTLEGNWFSVLYLASCLISKGGFVLIVYHTLKVSILLQYEHKTLLLQEQLNRQMNHYHSYQDFTKSFRVFRHDFMQMMSGIKSLLQSGEQEKAISLMDEIYDTMRNNVHIHNIYSNNMLLDAILQDTANICKSRKIEFTATLHLPDRLPLSDLETIRIFSNLLSNSVEACSIMDPSTKRFLRIHGASINGWMFVEIVNSFNGLLKQSKGKLVTTKSNKDFHGMGLSIVEEIVQSIRGFILIDPHVDKRVFVVKIHLPLEIAVPQGDRSK